RNRPAYDLRLYSLNTDIKWEHELMKHVKGKLGISWMQQQNNAAGVAFIIPHFNAHTAGVYLMEKWEHAKWILEAGLRYDMRWLNANSTRRFNELDESRTFSNFNGIISLVRLLPRQWILTTTTSTGWRAPAINELYSNGLHAANASYEIGDKTLKPEQSLMLDAVIKKEAKTGRIEIGIYSHYITDFIYQRPNRQPTLTIRGAFPTFQFSQTNAWLNGADISAEKVWFKQWQIGIAISYLYANDAKSNEPLIYMPANRLRMHASYLFDNGKRLSQTAVELRGNYVMRQWRYVTGIDYTDPPPAYFLLGLHVRTHIKVCNNNWMLSMDLHNLLNTRYRDYLSRFRYFTDDAGFDLVLRLSIPFTFSTPVNINN
ncbi:MAG: TonB-dependent receptor domain-containing protein, partial [Bacteroidota bacterium]